MSGKAAAGKLDLIIGCMFSGKSSELMRHIKMFRLLNRQLIVINHSLDQRYTTSNQIMNHDLVGECAISLSALLPIIETNEYTKAECIFIDEAQFFEDLYEFVVHAVEVNNKHVIVSGLDGDYKRKPFKNVLDLIPIANSVKKLNALCLQCKDGTPGCFSKRISSPVSSSHDARTLVGGNNTYISVCRHHFLNES